MTEYLIYRFHLPTCLDIVKVGAQQKLGNLPPNSLKFREYSVLPLQVATYMSYLDKLGLKEQYGDYKSDQLTCRGSTTPDGLTDVKVNLKSLTGKHLTGKYLTG